MKLILLRIQQYLTRANWTICCCWWIWPLGGRRIDPVAVRASAAVAILGIAPTDLHVTAPLAELGGREEV